MDGLRRALGAVAGEKVVVVRDDDPGHGAGLEWGSHNLIWNSSPLRPAVSVSSQEVV
ncbi:hypothetical protein [Pseudofrankia sp. DC12]|uniref:hypothetical protein n=1 Tax=Pseudofrankia sp. DC12 TaxID=683315 RepID=UPI0018DD7B83|nr:hypothetical protein [Pseudofrankia sp. DC12]